MLEGLYLFRRSRITNSAPESRAKAVPPKPGSISGTAPATASPDTPIKSKIIPKIFVTFGNLPKM
jgi:hypothetical protein